jgi:hypothetical protein
MQAKLLKELPATSAVKEMVRVDPNDKESPFDNEAVYPAMFIARDFKLPAWEVPKLLVQTVEAALLARSTPIVGVGPDRLRLVLPEISDGD